MKQILSIEERERLQDLIKKKYPTQFTFCAVIGVNPSIVSKILSGVRKIDEDELKRWRKFL